MESGNSSSMQSSSGGGVVGRAGAGIGGGADGGGGGGGGDDQEYESSVGNSSNYFFNTSTTTPPPASQLQQQYNSSMQQHFLFSNNPPPPSFDSFGDQSNFQNIMFWQQPQQQQQQPLQQQQQQPPQQQHTTTTTTTTTNLPLPPSTSSGKGTGTSGSGQKNPRKRTRASRRAPTTVLTTDTTNFRAMVQEFTGIPSSPFSAAASPFLSRRLTDLFTGSAPAGPLRPAGLSAAAAGSSSGGSHLERLLAGYSNTSSGNPNFPFRPSAHKPLINTSNLGITPSTHDQHTNLPFQSLLQTGAISSSPSSLLLPSVSNSNRNNNATLRYNSPGGLLSGGSGLPAGVHFQELSGILGNHHQMFLSSTDTNPNLPGGGSENVNVNAFSLPSHMGGGVGSGEEGGWRTRPSNDEINNVGNDGNNNDSSNQQMEGTISGSGTATNYDHRNHNHNRNRNHNVSNSNANAGSSTAAQGTLGNFLD